MFFYNSFKLDVNDNYKSFPQVLLCVKKVKESVEVKIITFSETNCCSRRLAASPFPTLRNA